MMWLLLLVLLDASSIGGSEVGNQAIPNDSTHRRPSQDSVCLSSLLLSIPELATQENASVSSVGAISQAQWSMPSGFTSLFESKTLKTIREVELPEKQPKVAFSGLLADTRNVRSVLGNTYNQNISPVNMLSSLMTHILEDKIPILLHDSKDLTLNVIDQYLLMHTHLPVVVFNISDKSLLKALWLQQYNAGRFLHILLFSSLNIVENFAKELAERVWVPSHLLLVNVNASVDASRLLAQENFNYSPFLSLLQPDSRSGTTRYHILTYETFRPHNKITTHGVYNFDQPQTYASVFPDRFSTFHGYNLQLATEINGFPFLVAGPTLEETSGISVDMLNEISRKLNFSVTYYKRAKDGIWAKKVNGSWYGLIGELWRREKDLCVNGFAIMHQRFEAVDFSVPFFKNSVKFVIRHPLPPPRWWSIVFPFTWQTWVAVLTSVVVVSVVLHVILTSLSRLRADGVCRSSVSWVVLEVVRTILRQDVTTSPPVTSVRVFEGMWLLLAMVISISYTGNLIAYITVPAKGQRLTSLKDMAESSLTPSLKDNGNFVTAALLSSQNPTLVTLGRKMAFFPVNNVDLIFEKLRDGTHSFLEATEYFQYLSILHNIASMTYFLPEALFQNDVGWSYPKNTPWKHKFDHYIQSMVESDLCRYWKKVLVSVLMKQHGNTLQQGSQEQPLRALSLQDLQGGFLIYGLFNLTAVIVGLLEVLYRL